MPLQKSKSIEAFEAQWKDWHAKNAAEQLPPRGAVSVYDYAKIVGCSVASAASVLRAKADAGLLKTGLFRVRRGGRIGQMRFWWRK